MVDSNNARTSLHHTLHLRAALPVFLVLLALPGYVPARGGQVLSLTQALPWWNFRQAKKAVGSGRLQQQPWSQCSGNSSFVARTGNPPFGHQRLKPSQLGAGPGLFGHGHVQ